MIATQLALILFNASKRLSGICLGGETRLAPFILFVCCSIAVYVVRSLFVYAFFFFFFCFFCFCFLFFFQAEDGIRDRFHVTGVQTCALPISEGINNYKYIGVNKVHW